MNEKAKKGDGRKEAERKEAEIGMQNRTNRRI
jgi:hypothetical protein